MKPYNVSLVSYLNSVPFRKSFELHHPGDDFVCTLDIPSVCAEKLVGGVADIGLIPVAMLPKLPTPYLITDYCIGADGDVYSVLLVADEPVESLTSVILDRESRTSVALADILLKEWWHINPKREMDDLQWKDGLQPGQGAILIGDKALKYRNQFRYCYDLAGEWKKMTGLPFVFACWVSNKALTEDAIHRLNESFSKGLEHREEIALELKAEFPETDIMKYLTTYIRFSFDAEARKGLALFLEKLGADSTLAKPGIRSNLSR